ncbi:MAG TPA: hypothetical protein VL356_02140 [Acidocella sp.]|jgi:hypothetical protein|nr:hypothetical protein [Acidocella sp.]
MSRWLLALCLTLGLGGNALAQTGGEVYGGLNSDGGAMYGASIHRVLGTNPNGTPRQLLPGASMTNGAGNSTMTPGITGGSVQPPPIRSFLRGQPTTIPTITGQPSQ